MFAKLMAIWKGERLMKKVVETFGEMLSDDEYLFSQSWEVFKGGVDIDDIKQPFYDKDSAVNEHERMIRRMLLEHLSLHPGYDVSGCLVIMSLTKDAERIGDYSKNILEVGILLEGAVRDMKYLERLSSTQEKIAGHFPELRQAFLESDTDMAKKILNEYAPIKSECNNILRDLFSEQMPTREAVSTALLSRYLKRINSHISNIASGVVYPIDQIDFVHGDILE